MLIATYMNFFERLLVVRLTVIYLSCTHLPLLHRLLMLVIRHAGWCRRESFDSVCNTSSFVKCLLSRREAPVSSDIFEKIGKVQGGGNDTDCCSPTLLNQLFLNSCHTTFSSLLSMSFEVNKSFKNIKLNLLPSFSIMFVV